MTEVLTKAPVSAREQGELPSRFPSEDCRYLGKEHAAKEAGLSKWSPGPGAYAPSNTTSFGKQVAARVNSAPSYSFGTSQRDKSEKHAKSLLGVGSPGPCEYSPKVDFKGHSFGDAPKFTFHGPNSAWGRDLEKRVTPGPGAYQEKSAMGIQKDSRKTSAPTYSFGRADRFNAARKRFLSHEHSAENLGVQSPGPAAYNQASGFGQQVSSTRQTAPKYTLGGP